VLFSEAGHAAVQQSQTTSFAADLKKWLSIAEEYRAGRAPYHATMPTDTLTRNVELMRATTERGLEALRSAQTELGARVREVLASRGLPCVAAEGYAATTVVVADTDDPDLRSRSAVHAH